MGSLKVEGSNKKETPEFPVCTYSFCLYTNTLPPSFTTVSAMTPSISPFRFSAGKQVAISHTMSSLEVQLIPCCTQSYIHVLSSAHIRSDSTSCCWISLYWHPSLCPLPALESLSLPISSLQHEFL